MIVARQFLRLQRTSFFIWAGVLVFLTVVTASSASAVTAGGAFQELIATLPVGFQRLIGADITNPVDGFIAIKLLLIVPALGAVAAVLVSTSVVAREHARGTGDFLLSLPAERRFILRQRFTGLLVGLSALYVCTWLALVITLIMAGLSASFARYAIFLLASLALNAGQAAVALALSLHVLDLGRSVRYALAFALIPYGFEIAFKSAGILSTVRYVLLYRLADPVEILVSPTKALMAVLVFGALTAVCLVWSETRFRNMEMEV